VPWQQQLLVRDFRQAQTTGPAKVRVETSGMFGARPVLGWTNTEVNARLTLPFTVETAGRHALRLTAAGAPEYGLYAIELDLALGTHELTAGPHTLGFRALPVDGRPARPLAAEMLRWLRLPPEATRPVKTHHEAHFIRLAIGRAVYAYRLAYGEVPASLDTLVKADLLSARYLSDENEKPLHSHRDGDSLVVESNGPEPWTYRWQGLDARR
jgi:hypothetical protein